MDAKPCHKPKPDRTGRRGSRDACFRCGWKLREHSYTWAPEVGVRKILVCANTRCPEPPVPVFAIVAKVDCAYCKQRMV